jgi:diguanylate cyclase (GGDEF)-like protein
VVLGGILALLERQLPAMRLVLLLDHVDPLRPRDRRVVARGTDAELPFWLYHRRPGSLAVLSDPCELPDAVREAFGKHAPVVTTVAVPLIEPAELGPDAYAEPRERGILFAATPDQDLAPHLLPLARQLTGFVTRRWRQQWTVNRRIHADSLTGVHNRAYFDLQFTIELERARRDGFPLTLVLGDLDWFKRVNDNHGHHYGDLMLQEVARGLQAALRRIDHICRIGGEEFALVLPHTTVAEASEVMGRLLARPFSVVLPAARGGGRLSVTMSYGVVTYPEAGADAFELYRKADAMLYLSKERGRNRCHFWREGENPLPLAAAAATG